MKASKKHMVIAAIVLVVLISLGSVVYSHCQIPCGIYGDPARFDMIAEHLQTIEKSMKQIEELSAAEKINYNQLIRWTNNKDDHAREIDQIITYYFMAQRVKPAEKSDEKAYGEYVQKITLLHQMLVTSMKCKQTTDVANVEMLRKLTEQFNKAYFDKHAHSH